MSHEVSLHLSRDLAQLTSFEPAKVCWHMLLKNICLAESRFYSFPMTSKWFVIGPFW